MHKPLNVCHISDSLPLTHNFWGGAEQACLRIMEASSRAGINVSAITTKPVKNVQRQDIRFFSSPTLESYIKANLIRSLKQLSIPFDPVSFFYIYKILKKIKPDIVHLHRVNILSLSSILSARLLDIPVVVSIYDYFYFCPKETVADNNGCLCFKYHGIDCVDCMKLSRPKFLKKAFLSIRKTFFNFLLQHVFYHVLSESSFKILGSYGIDKKSIHKVLQIFPLSCTIKQTAIKEGMILYIGWIQERKGFHMLLKAMPEIIKACPNAYIIAIGEINNDAYFQCIQALIKDNNLDSRVKLLGKKDYTVVSEYMNEANVVVIPEQWENMSPVVLVEAMSYGKAVVASNIGGIPEFMLDKKTGFLANTLSPLDFSDKIISILKNKDMAIMLGIKARHYITELMDEKRVMGEYKAMYETVIRAKYA